MKESRNKDQKEESVSSKSNALSPEKETNSQILDTSENGSHSEDDSLSNNDNSNLSDSIPPCKIPQDTTTAFNEYLSTQVNDSLKDFSQTNNNKIQKYTEEIKRIHKHFNSSNKKYEDKQFPPLNHSLFRTASLLDEALQELKTWNWVRPEEILKRELMLDASQVNVQELRLGPLSNQSLANVLSAVFLAGIVDNLVVDVDNARMGYVTFQFMKNGEWHYVIVDTLLPYASESKKWLFINSNSQDGILLALMEKAYAKLNGCYEHVSLLSLSAMLLETGFYQIEKINLEKDVKDPTMVKKTFANLGNYFDHKEKVVLLCEKQNKQTSEIKNAETSGLGIMENALHLILSFEDFSNKDLRFVCVKNIWGHEYNWSGPFANNSDDWEKHKDIRDTLFSNKKFYGNQQTVYYMKMESFLKEFTKVYVLHYYSPELTTYSLKGIWQENSLAGMPSDLGLKYPLSVRRTTVFTKMDSDDRWFNNPQYRLQVFEPTKVVIDFSQLDTTAVGVENHFQSIGFSVFKTSNNKNRVWELPASQNLLCSVNNKLKKNKAMAEHIVHDDVSDVKSNENEEDNEKTIQLPLGTTDNKSLFEGKSTLTKERYQQNVVGSLFLEPEPSQLSSFYTILVYANVKKAEKTVNVRIPFNLKVIASKRVEIEPLPQTFERTIEEQWDGSSAGGAYFSNQNGSSENMMWCFNPQYLLNFSSPTSLKIILQKSGKNLKKLKDAKLGLSLCYLKPDNENEKHPRPTLNSKKKTLNLREELLQKLLEKTKDHLQVRNIPNPFRKIKVQPTEHFVESSFASTQTACLFLKVLPVEGPLLLAPCLDKAGLTGDFKITVFSSAEITIVPLDKTLNPVLLGEWTQYNSGGSHIYNEQLYSNPEKRTWTNNPIFKLSVEAKIMEDKPVKIRLALNFAELNWKSKLIRKVTDSESKKLAKKSMVNVDSMICLYVLKSSTKLSTDNIIFQSPFTPSAESVFEFEFKASDFNNMKSCLIMPTTFNVC